MIAADPLPTHPNHFVGTARSRAHRPVLGSVSVLLTVLLTSGCAINPSPPAGTDAPTQAASATTPAPSEPTASSSFSAQAEAVTLSPTGLGSLKLGMNKSEARGTGQVEHVTGSKGTCGGGASDGWLKVIGKPTDEDTDGKLAFSMTSNKLVAIFAYPGLRTDEGIGLGSSRREVEAAYPDWEPREGGDEGPGAAETPGDAKSVYIISVWHGRVTELVLESEELDCWG